MCRVDTHVDVDTPEELAGIDTAAGRLCADVEEVFTLCDQLFRHHLAVHTRLLENATCIFGLVGERKNLLDGRDLDSCGAECCLTSGDRIASYFDRSAQAGVGGDVADAGIGT
jgi:hypothetical protein